MDTIFKTKSEVSKDVETKPIEASSQAKTVSDVEPPYLDYRAKNSRPYVADHFQLGDTWEDPRGGFPKEVSTIEEYFKEKIEYGEIANDISAIKAEIKKIERLNNIDKESRPLVRIETVAAYIEFLNKTNKLKENLRHYGSTKYQ